MQTRKRAAEAVADEQAATSCVAKRGKNVSLPQESVAETVTEGLISAGELGTAALAQGEEHIMTEQDDFDRFWQESEHLGSDELVLKSKFIKALKTELKVHPYVFLCQTYTLCGREAIVNRQLAEGLYKVFGRGKTPMTERVTRLTASLLHSTTGMHGWFWGYLELADVDKVLKDAVHDGSFLLRINHRKPGIISLSFVEWRSTRTPGAVTAATVTHKVIHTIQIQWDEAEQGLVGRFVGTGRSATWKKIGPYATIPHMLAYLSSAKIIGTSFPTSPLSWELRIERFIKKNEAPPSSSSSSAVAVAAAAAAGSSTTR